MTDPRGIRNNNPGNIRIEPGVDWVGSCSGSDADFVTFKSPEYGVRAMAEILHSYWVKDGVTTISSAIARWAPPSENNTSSYADDVAQRCGVDRDVPTDLPTILPQLLAAIIAHENGNYAYPSTVIQQGITLAGIS